MNVSVSQSNKMCKELCIAAFRICKYNQQSHVVKVIEPADRGLWVHLISWCSAESLLCFGLSIPFLDTLFNTVTGFPSSDLNDMMHTCLNASGGGWITWDHVSPLRVGCIEWNSVLFCVLSFCWGSVHSFYPQQWCWDKNYPSSGAHVNQSGGI